jgi:hypothetical protein
MYIKQKISIWHGYQGVWHVTFVSHGLFSALFDVLERMATAV